MHASKGRVHGVIPSAMIKSERASIANMPEDLAKPKSWAEAKVSDRSIVSIVESMHERKRIMFVVSNLLALDSLVCTMLSHVGDEKDGQGESVRVGFLCSSRRVRAPVVFFLDS